jgi:hypothetical protein
MSAYVSLNMQEIDILEAKATLREIAMYLILKRRANFKTGVFGNFRKQRLTYAALGELLSRPPSQGRAAENYDGSEASRVIDGLERLGLVAERAVTKGRLTMTLPLSPIIEVATPEATASKAPAGKLPQPVAHERPATQMPQGIPANDASLSLLTKQNLTSYISNDSSVGADAPETPTMETPQTGRFAAGPFESVADVENRMRAVTGMHYAEGRVSRTIYERWIQHAIPRDEIERAINEVRDDFTIEATPKAIDDLLRRWKKGTGRGRVAL